MPRLRSRLDALARQSDRPTVFGIFHIGQDGCREQTEAEAAAWEAVVRAAGGEPLTIRVHRVNAPPALTP